MKFTTFKGFPIVPAGTYDAEVLSAEQSETGTKLIVEFNLTDPKTLEEFTKKEWLYPEISDAFPLFKHLVALSGITGDEGEFDPQSFVGLTGVATVTHSIGKKDGKTYANVVSILKKA